MKRTITNLTNSDVSEIVKIIDSWPMKKNFNWEGLVDEISLRLGKTWSRQSLHKHTLIKYAYDFKKKKLRVSPPAPMDEDLPPDLRVALERIRSLESESERLKMENERLLEQFATWAYNAEGMGLLHVLHRPLPPVNRGSTRDEELDKKPRRPTDRPRVR
jgi:hypothetical protein